MKSREIESLLTRILREKEPIQYKILSNLLYIIEAIFSQIKISFPITYNYTYEGLISDDLKFILERLSNKEMVTIEHQSPSIIKLSKNEPEEYTKEFEQKYHLIIEQINALLELEMNNQEIINLAKMVRINKIIKIGMIEQKDFLNRVNFDRINIERMEEIIKSSNLSNIMITPSQRR